MAQGEFTKDEVKETAIAFEEVFNALTKKKQSELSGHAIDILLFLDAAGVAALIEPTEPK
jgi:hypothetical protein